MSVFVCSDLHGMMESYNQIKAFIKPEDKVYCLGDCGDRGPEPWGLIKAIANDKQFEYIKGNHEDMLVSAMYEYNDGYMDFFTKQLIDNGGGTTLLQWANEGGDMRWARWLERLPLSAKYTNKDGIQREEGKGSDIHTLFDLGLASETGFELGFALYTIYCCAGAAEAVSASASANKLVSRIFHSTHNSEVFGNRIFFTKQVNIYHILHVNTPYQYSSGSSSSSSNLKTGPSLQTYLLPTLHLPHLPIPHFIRSSRVV